MLLDETNPVVCTQKMSTHLIYPKFKWMRIGFKLLDILIHRFSVFLKVGNEKGITLLKAHVCWLPDWVLLHRVMMVEQEHPLWNQ